jgi:hypothetical protein
VFEQLNAVLAGKLTEDRLLRARKLRIGPTNIYTPVRLDVLRSAADRMDDVLDEET